MKPWIMGLIDHLAAAKLLQESKIGSRNRLSLILLDSALELGFKKYLTYEKGIKLEKPVLEYRDVLHKVVRKNTSFDAETWREIEFYYDARCDLYHERSEKTLTDPQLDDFFALVVKVFNHLFDIDTQSLIPSPKSVLPIKIEGEFLRFVIPVDVVAFLKQHNITEEHLSRLFFMKGNDVRPIYNISVTKKGTVQIQLALLTALENALKGSNFEFLADSIREKCIKYGCYDPGNFRNNFKNNLGLFIKMSYEEPVELSRTGLDELGRVILAIVK